MDFVGIWKCYHRNRLFQLYDVWGLRWEDSTTRDDSVTESWTHLNVCSLTSVVDFAAISWDLIPTYEDVKETTPYGWLGFLMHSNWVPGVMVPREEAGTFITFCGLAAKVIQQHLAVTSPTSFKRRQHKSHLSMKGMSHYRKSMHDGK